MNFNIHQSCDETGYLLDSLITPKTLKLLNNISNHFIINITDFFNNVNF